METDENLYRSMKSGLLSAFDELYERHRRGLMGFVLRYLERREEAEEVFHETFLALFEQEGLDFAPGTLRGWLYLTARNRALNRLRARGRAVASDPREELREPDAETRLIEHAREVRVREAARSLPPAMAELLRLKLAGVGSREIAGALGVPVGTVKSRFHALARRLREGLGE